MCLVNCLSLFLPSTLCAFWFDPAVSHCLTYVLVSVLCTMFGILACASDVFGSWLWYTAHGYHLISCPCLHTNTISYPVINSIQIPSHILSLTPYKCQIRPLFVVDWMNLHIVHNDTSQTSSLSTFTLLALVLCGLGLTNMFSKIDGIIQSSSKTCEAVISIRNTKLELHW